VTIVYVTHDQIEAMTLATKVAVMRGGEIQQMAAPQEIYDRPANLFVAGFIGSPSMNLITGILDESGGRAVVRIARNSGQEVRLAIGSFSPEHTRYRGSPVILGVRPEAIAPNTAGAAEGTSFEARIDVIEPTGADSLAFFTLGGSDVIARLPSGKNAAGERVRLQIDPARAMLFDPKTEALIG
jgi:multiple sugar transport system ATP-binding protein